MEDALDLTAADWERQSLTTFAKDVGSVVPDRFAAYARILHPLEGMYTMPMQLRGAST